MSERNRERAKKWLKEHAGDIWPVPAADSFTALLDEVEQQGYEEAREQAAEEIQPHRQCHCREVNCNSLAVGQEHWGDCIERLYRAIRAMKPGRG